MNSDKANTFRKESLDQLRSLHPDQVKLFHNEPIRENYTLVVRPEGESLKHIKNLIEELREIASDQYYYRVENLHLTIIGNIPVEVDVHKLTQAIEKALSSCELDFNLLGLGSNQFCSSVSAYPHGFSVHELRGKIRQIAGVKGDDYSSILDSYEYVGWINYLRYLTHPSQMFLDRLYEHRNTKFGHLKPRVAQLFKNTSKVLDTKTAKLVKEWQL